MALGATVRELEAGASVGDVLVHNPLDVGLLLYEGEEITGARQDRTFDRSVLVPAGRHANVPVSCVEAGRWDGGRHGEAFSASPRAAFSELRRAKSGRRTRAARATRTRARSGRWSTRRPRATARGHGPGRGDVAAALGAACPAERVGVGLGAHGRFATAAAEGARLWHGPELVALTAFAPQRPATRVRRPSRRR